MSSLKDLIKKTIPQQSNNTPEPEAEVTPAIPEGLWKKCNHCQKPVYSEDVISNCYICPECHSYFRMHAGRRIRLLTDEGSFEEWDRGLSSGNPLKFPGYEAKLRMVKEKTRLDEAVTTGKALINGIPVVLGVCDSRFFMSSMGQVVGEKITRAFERAAEQRLPVILLCCSGGARMQEGIVSLMQMAKTSAAIKRHSEAGLLYISVLTDPTTGGVTASFAMLGDVILAEPGALIGFAGPRVIEQTIHQKLPEGFQRSEFLLEHGFLDAVVERKEMKNTLSQLLLLHQTPEGPRVPKEAPDSGKELLKKMEKQAWLSRPSAWERVKLSRKPGRLTGLDYIDAVFTGFTEFHGDRLFGDDGAIVGGIALFEGIPVTVVAQQKGRGTKENIRRNFGMPSPEGYRKALRLMKQAEKFGRPVICFVDTPGAFCGIEAEERGQGEAIARNLYEMSSLRVPILSIITGEGGSGGALAMAAADEVWMLENSTYSILSPEGFASILWKDGKKAREAAEVMKLTAQDLLELKIIEQIIPEAGGAEKEHLEQIAEFMTARLRLFLNRFLTMGKEELSNHRYGRFRRM